MKRFKITVNAPMLLGFVLCMLIATILGQASNDKLSLLLFATYRSSWTDPLTYVRLFSHVLGHSGWAHFFGNASMLLLLGPMLEEKYGSRAILEAILLTGLVTSVVQRIFFPSSALLGASGVVFAFILMSSFTSFRKGELPITFILIFVIYIGEQIYSGLSVQDNISNTAHIIGGLVGAVSGYVLNRKN